MENKPESAVAPKTNNSSLVLKTYEDKFQASVIRQLDNFAKDSAVELTEYGRTCAYNVIGGLITHCRTNNIPLNKIDPVLLGQQIRNIAYTELNIAASPAECYFDLRKVRLPNEDGTIEEMYAIKIAPQGAGNEKLVRKFGVNVKELHTAWLIREGDEYTLPSWEGGKLTPPSWKMKSVSGKVIMVIYRITKTDGSEEYLIADRESVKQSLIAQIRQNSLYAFKKWVTDKNGKRTVEVDTDKRNEFYKGIEDNFESKVVDECLKLDEYQTYINPTYTSGGSKESMMVRKMKNIALKNYPKEYDSSLQAQAAAELNEDYDETIREGLKPKQVVNDNVIDAVEAEVDEVNPNAVPDFEIPDEDMPEEVTPEQAEPKEEPKPQDGSGDPEEMF